jgi:hypothetical protein
MLPSSDNALLRLSDNAPPPILVHDSLRLVKFVEDWKSQPQERTGNPELSKIRRVRNDPVAC